MKTSTAGPAQGSLARPRGRERRVRADPSAPLEGLPLPASRALDGSPPGGADDRTGRLSAWLLRLRFSAGAYLWASIGAMYVLGDLRVSGRPIAVFFVVTVLANGLLLAEGGRPWLNTRRGLGAILVADVLTLTGLLYLAGGPRNPLTIFFVIPVMVSAFILGRGWTLPVAVLCAACYGVLFPLHHVPIAGEMFGQDGGGFRLHLYWMYVAFVGVALCLGAFVGKLVSLMQADQRRLLTSRARNDRFAALVALAGGAAHELGTPLATIAVVSRELDHAAPDAAAERVRGDARLIRQQVERCRAILDQLHPSAVDARAERVDLGPVIEAVAAHHAPGRIESDVRGASFVTAPPALLRMAVEAVVGNAVDASAAPIHITVGADGSRALGAGGAFVEIAVRDTGTGMPPEVLERSGEPFFTTKPPGQGMGLGLFIARLLADRTGGSFAIDSSPGEGTIVRLSLPAAGPAHG